MTNMFTFTTRLTYIYSHDHQLRSNYLSDVRMYSNTPSQDDKFILDCQTVIMHCHASSSLAVRVQASWALANLVDSFSSHPHLLQPQLMATLSKSVLLGLEDKDKIRSNAVRAAGNLLKQLPEEGTGREGGREGGPHVAWAVPSASNITL